MLRAALVFAAGMALATSAAWAFDSGNCLNTIAINQTASTELYVPVNKMHICGLALVNATAQNLSLVEGTGTVCGTGTKGLIGGSTASMAFANNGILTMASSMPFLSTAVKADHLCLLQSSTGNVSGTITFNDQ